MSSVERSCESEIHLKHSDGRGVRGSVFGARDLATVVFYSHGFPASRIEAAVAHRVAKDFGLTIVALDRPGFGGSDWYAHRQFEDWATDVELVANHLNVEKFAILGVSGGTPTAVAAAARLTDRVTSLGIVSGIGPLHDPHSFDGMNIANRGLLKLAQVSPSFGRWSIGTIAGMWRVAPALADLWFGLLLPAVDKAIVTRRDVGVVLAKNIRESLSQGVRGAVTEFMLLTTDWRPLLAEVRVPTTIWHGDADTYVPLGMATILQKGISGSTLHEVKGGGHFMIIDTLHTILERFVRV